MLFERNNPYTQETLLDKENILELIQFERFVAIMPYGIA